MISANLKFGHVLSVWDYVLKNYTPSNWRDWHVRAGRDCRNVIDEVAFLKRNCVTSLVTFLREFSSRNCHV